MHIPPSHLSYSGALEWWYVARSAGYTITEYLALDTEVQAYLIAAYRTDQRIQAVLSQDAEKRSRRGAGKNRG